MLHDERNCVRQIERESPCHRVKGFVMQYKESESKREEKPLPKCEEESLLETVKRKNLMTNFCHNAKKNGCAQRRVSHIR